jgi:hypothetical protein
LTCSAMSAPSFTWARLRQTCKKVHAHYLPSRMHLVVVVVAAAAAALDEMLFPAVRDPGQ